MLSLLVRIFLAAVCGDGFTKLTVCDFFLASDLLGDRRRALCDEADMLLLFPLRRFDPAALAVGQQQVLPVCFQHEEVFALLSAGREQGKYFFVLETDGEYLLLADGKSRRIEAPKRKKQKHVRFIAESAAPVAEKIRSKEKITNSELRKAIAAYSGKENPDQEG